MASIPRYCFAEDKYWFVIQARLEDGRWWELSRYYEDFYDFQIALLTEFPSEAGNTGSQKRTLPYMPGPVNYVTDAITEGRQHNLDAYVKTLLAQPPYISRCILVKQFFAPREGDYEIPPPQDASAEARLSGDSAHSSNASHSASRQNSRNNLQGAGYASSPHQRNLSGMSPIPNGTSMTRQGSLTQTSPAMPQNGPTAASMKIKIYFGDDLIAIRVPVDIKFPALHDKIRERLKIAKGKDIVLRYKDEPTGEHLPMLSIHDLDTAISRNEKLIIYAEYAGPQLPS